MLTLAPDLILPDNFATEGVIVLGVRGGGKTNTEVVFAEALFDLEIPFVVIDPKPDWWGIQLSGDGTGPGLPIPIFGGRHGNAPLAADMGEAIADLLVDENMSAILDVSQLSKTRELPRFLTAFFNRLVDRHKAEEHVRCVIMEEAHRYIPQVVKGIAAELKEAAASILLEGRSFGLGCLACSQRPARIHNDVLEEVDTAIIHRIGVTATADLKRVREWVRHEDLGPEIGASLTKLRNGQAWVLSPVALEVIQLVQMNRRRTYDSGATPKVGARAHRPAGTLATVDMDAINVALAVSIEKAKEDDPKHLRARIGELEALLAAAPAVAPPAPAPVPVPFVPVEVAQAAELAGVLGGLALDFIAALGKATEEAEGIASAADELFTLSGTLQSAVDAAPAPTAVAAVPPAAATPASPVAPHPLRGAPAAARARSGAGSVGRAHVALAQVPTGLTRRTLCARIGLAAGKSTIRNALSALRKNGWIDERGDLIVLTDAGRAALPDDYEPLPTGAELLAHWRGEIGGGAAGAVFEVLLGALPERLARDTVAGLAGLDPAKSTIRNAYSKLRSFDLVEGDELNPDFIEAIGR